MSAQTEAAETVQETPAQPIEPATQPRSLQPRYSSTGADAAIVSLVVGSFVPSVVTWYFSGLWVFALLIMIPVGIFSAFMIGVFRAGAASRY